MYETLCELKLEIRFMSNIVVEFKLPGVLQRARIQINCARKVTEFPYITFIISVGQFDLKVN